MNNIKENFGIYVHIPFCQSKCFYCNFVSNIYDENIKEKYFANLQNEILDNNLGKQKNVTSIYFGGGTPSSVNEKFIIKTLQALKKSFQINDDAEISIECNPNSVDLKKLTAYKEAGFTRISFGAQSFNDEVLVLLGRKHKSSHIFDSVQMANKVGYNISIDLIIGITEIDYKNFVANIEKLKNLGLKHISVYMLMLEEKTKLYNDFKNKKFNPLSEDKSVRQYNDTVKILKNLGFDRYEISNFALSGYDCKHNLNYWNSGEYLGFGVASHSYINRKRIENSSDIQKYINTSDKSQIKKMENLINAQIIEENIMLSLRTKSGINLKLLKNLGFDILKEKANEINFLAKNNLITVTSENLFVNEDYFGVVNSIILKLIP